MCSSVNNCSLIEWLAGEIGTSLGFKVKGFSGFVDAVALVWGEATGVDGFEIGVLEGREVFATSPGTTALEERIAFDVGGGTFCVPSMLFFRIDLGPTATEPVSTLVFVLLFAGVGLLVKVMPPFPVLLDEALSSSSESFRLLFFLSPSSFRPVPKLFSTIHRSLGSPDGIDGPSPVPALFKVFRVDESEESVVGVGDTNTGGAGGANTERVGEGMCENRQWVTVQLPLTSRAGHGISRQSGSGRNIFTEWRQETKDSTDGAMIVQQCWPSWCYFGRVGAGWSIVASLTGTSRVGPDITHAATPRHAVCQLFLLIRF